METLTRMLEIQNALNIVTAGEDWAEQGLDWRLAITQEVAELIDSLNWKWWKKQKVDVDNARVEIVDIWHFTLSIMIEEKIKPDEMLETKMRALTNVGASVSSDDNHELIKHCKNINKVAANNSPALEIVDAVLMAAGKLGMSFGDITKLYIGKSVLNNFRQLNGYQDGSYKKDWDGKEDNEVMMEIVDSMKYAEYDNSFEEKLMNALTERYMIIE